MFLNKYYNKINFLFLILICFFIPLHKKIIPFIILLYGINWLFIQNYREKCLLLKQNIGALLMLISLFVIYFISLLYTDNIETGLFDIEVKLSLILFPLMIFTSSPLTVKNFNKILNTFLYACFLACLISFTHAIQLYIESKDYNAFIYTNFSFIFHPTYFALYLNVAAVISFKLFTEEAEWNYKSWLSIFLFLFFGLCIFLSNSKAVIITFVITIFFSALYLGYLRKKLILSLIISFLIIITTGIVVLKSPELSHRIMASMGIIDDIVHHEVVSDYESTSQRIEAWKSSLTVIKNNFFLGVGAGDVKEALIEEYKLNNYEYLIEKRLNSHNQFLQTFIATGVLGFSALLLIFIVPLVLSIKKRNYLYLMFILITFINFLTESMLETQAGVVFFGFFNTVFLLNLLSESKKE